MSHIASTPSPLLTEPEVHTLRESGREIAKGHDLEHDDDAKKIQANADGFAASVKTHPYDPQNNPGDRLLDERFHSLQAELHGHVEPALERAGDAVRHADAEVAAHHQGLIPPTVPAWIVPTAILVLSLTIAPTLHDEVFLSAGSELLVWAISSFCAAFAGAFIVWSFLGSFAITAHRPALNWLGLFAGIGVGVGLGLLRAAHATTTNEYVFAAALTIVEMSVVLALEFMAMGLRVHHSNWQHQEQELAPRRQLLDAARAQEQRYQHLAAHVSAQRDAHLEHVHVRHIRHFHTAEIASAAKREIEVGYREQLSANWLGAPQSVRHQHHWRAA